MMIMFTFVLFSSTKWYEKAKIDSVQNGDKFMIFDSANGSTKVVRFSKLSTEIYTPSVVDSINENDNFTMFDSVGLNNKSVPFSAVQEKLAKYTPAVVDSVNDNDNFTMFDSVGLNNKSVPFSIVRESLKEPVSLFAYSMPDTVIFTKADTWYVLKGAFTNEINEGFGFGTTGIKYIDPVTRNLEAEYMLGGISDDDAVYRIGLVKNGTFDETTGELTVGSVLPGSGGGAEAVVLAGSRGFVNMRGFWAGSVAENDELTIVYQCDNAGTELSPTGASASIHKSK